MQHNIRQDKRYTQGLEYCGYSEPRYVARFCGAYLGEASTELSAIAICQEAYNARMAAYQGS